MKNTLRISTLCLILASGIMLVSCGNKIDQETLNRVEKISASLDSAANKLLEVNDDTLKEKFTLFKATSEKLEKDFYAIKTDENFADICQYRECKKPLRNMVSNYKLFQKEADTSAAQLERLRHDIKKGLLTKEETGQFIALEEQNAKVLLKRITKSVDDAVQYEKCFDTLQPRILEYIKKATPKK